MGLATCPTTNTTTPYTPITGIRIVSSSLVAGHGCGTARGQVYKYAALVSYAVDGAPTGAPVYAGVFDCFTDGLFENLLNDAGNQDYAIQIYAWDYAELPQDLKPPCPPTVPGKADTCPADNPSPVLADAQSAQWSTTCTATPQAGITVLAVCAPLAGPGAGDAGGDAAGDAEADADAGPVSTQVHIPTQSLPLAAGGSISCGTDYDQDDAFYAVGMNFGMTGMAACGPDAVIEPATPNATYTIHLYLVKNAAALWESDCTATAQPNASTVATCAPAVPTSDAGTDGGTDGATDALPADAPGDATDASTD